MQVTYTKTLLPKEAMFSKKESPLSIRDKYFPFWIFSPGGVYIPPEQIHDGINTSENHLNLCWHALDY